MIQQEYKEKKHKTEDRGENLMTDMKERKLMMVVEDRLNKSWHNTLSADMHLLKVNPLGCPRLKEMEGHRMT